MPADLGIPRGVMFLLWYNQPSVARTKGQEQMSDELTGNEGAPNWIIESWLASGAADLAAEYAARGRKHQNLSDDALSSGWVSAFRDMVANIDDLDRRAALRDFDSELSLRGQEPRYDLVRDELDRFRRAACGIAEQLERDDPVKFEQMERQADSDLREFVDAWGQPKN